MVALIGWCYYTVVFFALIGIPQRVRDLLILAFPWSYLIATFLAVFRVLKGTELVIVGLVMNMPLLGLELYWIASGSGLTAVSLVVGGFLFAWAVDLLIETNAFRRLGH